MNGTLYGVGVGPGNKKFLTLEAVEILQKADVIAIPESGGEAMALKTVRDYIGDKELLACPMPMTRDQAVLKEAHLASADKIASRLDQGKDVAFITIGDPVIYSTYIYLHRILREKGYTARIVSGVPSFCAVAAALNISLCDGGQPLLIIPASYDKLGELLPVEWNKVLMKSGKSLEEVKEKLRGSGLSGKASMVEYCSLENERIFTDLELVDENMSYFSTIVVKE